MEFLKDLVKYFLEGMIEWLAENYIYRKKTIHKILGGYNV